jgi:DNA-binding NarL/FixJ family response regulator
MSAEPTARELEVFAAVCVYGCYKDAARVLGIAPYTVRTHLHRLYVKKGVGSLSEAAIALGWLKVPRTSV